MSLGRAGRSTPAGRAVLDLAGAVGLAVILIFLRSMISTLIISVAIPLSLLLTMVAMYLLGQTLNIFTLGGLALAVGRLVDDSIVELENINRHLAMPGKPRRLAVLEAAREVAMPIFVSTITTIVVSVIFIFIVVFVDNFTDQFF
mgnify:CR=1 FL=1